MKIKTVNGPVDFVATVPVSKSILARMLVMSALSFGKCVINNVFSFSEDNKALINALTELGVKIDYDKSRGILSIEGCNGDFPVKEAELNCESAGTAARFLTAMLSFCNGTFVLKGSAQLCRRPMGGLINALKNAGVNITCLEKENCLPVRIEGHKPDGNETLNFTVDSFESTQYVSGLMMILAYLPNESTILSINETRSSYLEITEKLLEKAGRKITAVRDNAGKSTRFSFENKQMPLPFEWEAEADVSSACYFYAVPMLTGGKVLVNGVRKDSIQGDMRFLNLLEHFGATLTDKVNGIELAFSEGISALPNENLEIDMSDFSDQVAAAAVLSAYKKGDTKITGIAHIRMQESDRIKAVAENLLKTGIECETGEDYLVIHGKTPRGAILDSFGDHRIAMAFSLMGLVTPEIEILGSECVAKTNEGFYDTLNEVYV